MQINKTPIIWGTKNGKDIESVYGAFADNTIPISDSNLQHLNSISIEDSKNTEFSFFTKKPSIEIKLAPDKKESHIIF
jgi:hypothetical protein